MGHFSRWFLPITSPQAGNSSLFSNKITLIENV